MKLAEKFGRLRIPIHDFMFNEEQTRSVTFQNIRLKNMNINRERKRYLEVRRRSKKGKREEGVC